MGGFDGSPGDRVYREDDRAQIDGLDRLLDLDEFRTRLREVVSSDHLAQDQQEVVQRLLAAWDARERGHDD